MGNSKTKSYTTNQPEDDIKNISNSKTKSYTTNQLEDDIKADSPTTERFKPFPYNGRSMGFLLPQATPNCLFCISIRLQNIMPGMPYFHVKRAIFITHLDNLVRVNYPGWIFCNLCNEYTKPRYIKYNEGYYTLTAAALSGNISYVKLENTYTGLYPNEIHYRKEIGPIFITSYPIEVICLPDIVISSKQGAGSYYVLEVETGGAIGFFRDGNKKSVVLDDLGNVVPSVSMDKTNVDNNVFIFTNGNIQMVIKKDFYDYNIVSFKQLKNGSHTKPAIRADE